jgi:hypothetical protein
MHFKELMPGLGGKYQVEIEAISKPKAEYQTGEYFELGLPVAPTVVVGDKIVVEGSNVTEQKPEEVIIWRELGLPAPC